MQFDQLKRREFITLLGGAAAAWPLAARAQQPAKLPPLGYLGANTPSAESQRIAAFLQRLRELGWIEGRTIAIEVRRAEGRNERFAEITAGLTRIQLGAIFQEAHQSGSGVSFDLVRARKPSEPAASV